ncbi:hypothetical protein [Calothrix rhizosoleniae]|uniref:hypothetical protein n=1 Tax=Calothrix rhizosoleniae TaxID=888997 RepID=UPI000B49A29C|nr:hypothetical protein [Calothrix rhizosoleniae]
MELSIYRHIAIAVSSLGLLLLTVGCYQLSISVEPDTTNSEVSPSASPVTNNPKSQIQQPNSTPTKNTVVAQITESNQKSLTSGKLRVSNRTDRPIRIALLMRRSGDKNAAKDKKYNIPAHWDFAPREGSGKGLILSLPQENLTLTKGDILVGFAEDGSRRYWGPYVVGKTPEPLWNDQQQEWQLILQQ